MKQFLSNSSSDEKIVAQYMLLYFYKIFRLIIIAVIITYFIGCGWYLLSYQMTSQFIINEAEKSGKGVEGATNAL